MAWVKARVERVRLEVAVREEQTQMAGRQGLAK